MQAKQIGIFAADGSGRVEEPQPSIVRQLEGRARRQSGSRSERPFGERGQTVLLLLGVAEPVAEGLSVLPGNSHHGMLVAVLNDARMVPRPPLGARLLRELFGGRLVLSRLDELSKLSVRDFLSRQV